MDLGKSSSEPNLEPPVKKARGRPRTLPKGSATEEEKRARARKIQHAFQQRRQAEVNQLQQRIATLESTVEVMSNEFLNFGDRVMQEPVTPGVLKNIRQTTKRFLDIMKEVGDPEVEGGLDVESASHGTHLTRPDVTKTTWPELPPPVTAPFEFNALFSTAIPNLNIPFTGSLSQQPSLNPLVSTTGDRRFSHRLDYGFVDHKWIPSSSTPWDNPWLTYLIAGPNSFASRLYIDSMDLLVRALRGEVTIPSFIPSTLRYRFRHENPDALMKSVVMQLQRMSLSGHKGSELEGANSESLVSTALSPNSPDAVFAAGMIMQSPFGVELLPEHRDNSPFVVFNPLNFVKINQELENLLVQIVVDITLEGGTPGDWLDPWSVQQYMDEEWGLKLNAATVRPTAKTLSVLQGYQVVRGEQEMNVGAHPDQSISGVQQEPPIPPLDFDDDFWPTLPLMPPDSKSPVTFYTDPLVAQRLAFSASMAPPAPPFHILTTIPTIQRIPVSSSRDTMSGHTHVNLPPSPAAIPPPIQPYQKKPSSSQNSTSAFGSGSSSSSSTSRSPRTETKLLSSSRSTSPPAVDDLIFLPETLPVTPLVTALILQSVCFGEGPRYQKPNVNETVRNFLESYSFARPLGMNAEL